MNYTYTIKVIEKSTGDVCKELEAISLGRAIKIRKGIEVNLNHTEYFVSVTKND